MRSGRRLIVVMLISGAIAGLCDLSLTLLGSGMAATVGKAYSGTPAPAVFGPVRSPI